MRNGAVRVLARIDWPTGPGIRRSYPRQRCRPRDNRPANGTDTGAVTSDPVPPSLARKRFAAFVSRALDAARRRGMTNKDIVAATGVGESTFHRWKRGEGRELPEIDRVRAYCAGLGESTAEAMRALGMAPGRQPTEPEPPLPPEVRTILRKLADPNVSNRDKLVINEMLKLLADQDRRRKPDDEADPGEEEAV